MKDHRISAVLALGAVFADVLGMGVVPSHAAYTDYTEGTYGVLTYQNYGDYIAISDCDAAATAVEIPAEIEGISVTEIARGAFVSCEQMTSLTIPETVTVIGELAIVQCPLLTEILVSEENPVFSSEDGVLYDKEQTALYRYPEGKTGKNFTIPDGVTVIGEDAFRNCQNLWNITIPESVETIDDFAFSDCYALRSIQIPDSVELIGTGAFSACINMTAAELPSGMTSIPNSLFVSCWSLREIEIPESVTVIYSYAFSECKALQQVELPDGVTNIMGLAFDGCESLTAVGLPVSLDQVLYGAFMNCTALSDVFYGGTEVEWDEVIVSSENDPLLAATFHYGSSKISETASSLGDLNFDGEVNATDASMILVAATNVGADLDSGLTDEQIAAADLNGDDAFDAVDASIVLQYATYVGAGGALSIEEFIAEQV